MNRRNFIKASGITLGSLLTANRICGSGLFATAQPIMRYPDQVQVVTDRQSIVLNGSEGTYSSGNIHVKCQQVHDGLAVTLASSEEAIRSVIINWHILRQLSTRIIGDHWERGYGDLQWKTVDSQRILPWYMVEYDGSVCHGFGVKTAPSAFCHWQASKDGLTLAMDTRSGGCGVRLGARTLRLATIVSLKGEEGERPFAFIRRFCKTMCDTPRLPKFPIYGINDWYFAYGNNSDKLILQTVDLMIDLARNTDNRPFCLIDAGWAVCAPGDTHAGCWSDNFYTPNPNFKDMGAIAETIREKGMRPGLWMRPLCASHDTPPNRLLPSIQRSDSMGRPLLDPTIPENLAYIEKCFKQYNEWGYEMVKHDFSTVDILGRWGFEMVQKRSITEDGWRFYDSKQTNAEVILSLYKTIRESAGDIYLIGCNTVSHLAAGLFELQRTGDDTSGHEWERTLKMGVNTVAFRGTQHNCFYASDGDCVGLTTQIDWNLNKQWMQLLAESGTPLFISAQPETVGKEQKEWIRHCFDIASTPLPVGEPLDWMQNQTPSRWLLRGEEKSFRWQ